MLVNENDLKKKMEFKRLEVDEEMNLLGGSRRS